MDIDTHGEHGHALVQCMWFGEHFDPDKLTTRDGRLVEVISPGWWNMDGSPDFMRAEVTIGGESLGDKPDIDMENPPKCVDVVIYTLSSDIDEVEGAGLIVVFEDDDTDRDFDVPVVSLSDACDEEYKQLLDCIEQIEK